jgi:hypothetical protein
VLTGADAIWSLSDATTRLIGRYNGVCLWHWLALVPLCYQSASSSSQVKSMSWGTDQLLTAVSESPRYLVWADKHDEAWKVLRKLHMNPEDHSDAEARAEFDQISRQVAYDKTQDSSYKHMFVKPSLRKRTIVVILLG